MFISFEGPDGGGKTLNAKRLTDFLRELGLPVTLTREPGGTPVGDQVRTVLMDLKNTGMSPRAEILLFQASRAELVEKVIRPKLAAGEIVVCDRYADSTLAYQGYGHRTPLEELRQVVHFATGGLTPDLTLLFDLDAEEGLKRRSQAGGWNRLDAYDLDFHRRVRDGFLELAACQPRRWVKIDAARSPEEVQAAVQAAVSSRLGLAK
jgi:dTMP kinase